MPIMNFSNKGLELLSRWEGEIDHVYKDAAGLPTIGIGHLLTRDELMSGEIVIKGQHVKFAGGITHQQALDLLDQDITPAESTVNASVHVDLTQDQFDALVIFTFNIGTGGFKSSSALSLLNQGRYVDVPARMALWNKITDPKTKEHKVCDGLVKRRAQEIKLWNSKI
jgi:lysozyme